MRKAGVLARIESFLHRDIREKNIKNVLVALSGGADSVALTLALKRSGLHVRALHCNFHLRGAESERDTSFVRQFCKDNKIELKTIDFDTQDYIASHKGTSVEMACRELRYKWFLNQLSLSGFDRIAIGHNADDNIETFFLNLLRGSGSRGLSGMKNDNGSIWRPLLPFHRKELLDYLNELGAEYIVDSSNLSNDYRRNYLRNEIIPKLKDVWKGFDKAIDKSIQNLSAENSLVEKLVNDVQPSTGSPLEVSTITSSPAPLLILKRFIDPAQPFSTTPSEILDAIKADKPHARKWTLRKGIVILRNKKLYLEISKN
ncbi:MAG: tRNA lysidine(34) synthetase TilS [Muribaculaceae bacterium]|nr:tRNA lysidine(34) synthetase TilS [Muribaculaceae bacterium]